MVLAAYSCYSHVLSGFISLRVNKYLLSILLFRGGKNIDITLCMPEFSPFLFFVLLKPPKVFNARVSNDQEVRSFDLSSYQNC